MFQADAHSSEPTRNRAMPKRSTGLRPKVSDSFP